MKNTLILLTLAVMLTACVNTEQKQDSPATDTTTKTATVDADYLTMAVLFSQRSAEYRALAYQGFQMARLILEQDMKAKSKTKKAVVLDIDETALDNSPYEAQCILGHFNYPEKWDEWCNLAIAEPIPGSVEFLNYATENAYEVFYITNRKAHLTESTIKNLKEKGFPFADSTHVMLRTAGSGKEERRQMVLKDYQISVFLGDNLSDFAEAFDGVLEPEKRCALVDSLKAEFGKRFVIFPNPMYGDWEMGFYPDPAVAPAVKDSLRKTFLKGF